MLGTCWWHPLRNHWRIRKPFLFLFSFIFPCSRGPGPHNGKLWFALGLWPLRQQLNVHTSDWLFVQIYLESKWWYEVQRFAHYLVPSSAQWKSSKLNPHLAKASLRLRWHVLPSTASFYVCRVLISNFCSLRFLILKSGSSFRWSMLDIMTSNSDLWTNLATELRLPLGSDMCSACFLVESPSPVHGSVLQTCRSKGPGKSICPPVWWQSQQQHAICEQTVKAFEEILKESLQISGQARSNLRMWLHQCSIWFLGHCPVLGLHPCNDNSHIPWVLSPTVPAQGLSLFRNPARATGTL